MSPKLDKFLYEHGWSIDRHEFNSIYDKYTYKNNGMEYCLIQDTSSWIMLDKVINGKCEHIFDINISSDPGWTSNLIMKLINDDIKISRIDKIDQIL